MDKNISFTLKVWRQAGPKAKGAFEEKTTLFHFFI